MGEPQFVTVSEAVRILDLSSRYAHPEVWLVRTLRAREKRMGMRILVSDREGKGARYRINVRTLRTVLDELKSPQDVASTALGIELAEIRRALRAIDDRLDDVEGNVGVVAREVAKLASAAKAKGA